MKAMKKLHKLVGFKITPPLKKTNTTQLPLATMLAASYMRSQNLKAHFSFINNFSSKISFIALSRTNVESINDLRWLFIKFCFVSKHFFSANFLGVGRVHQ
ncbi:MAG: hypothetical protein HC815_27525 [Richelia sp. RM1_1_1]|nr:hypothetical protein [Richelia sp. RM1_1_1]